MPLERGAPEIGGLTGSLTYSRKNRTTKEVAKSVVAFTKAVLDCLRTFPTSTVPSSVLPRPPGTRHGLRAAGFAGNVWRFGKYPLL